MQAKNIHEAKTHLSSILAQVCDDGESFLICKNGKPIADLVPHCQKNRLKPHAKMKQIKIKFDPVEPLSDSEWPEKDRL